LCMSMPACVAIDFDTTTFPDSFGCWIHTAPDDIVQNPDVTQYNLDRMCNNAGCSSWIEIPGVQSSNGEHYPDYNTIATCQGLCISMPACVAIDFDTTISPDSFGCWIHTAPDDIVQNPDVTQYTLDRMCINADNLALRKPTYQSTTYNQAMIPQCSSSSNAVDGNRDPDLFHCSCSHTNASSPDSPNPSWWAVDLQALTSVARVIITNRADCCEERLRDFDIGLTDIDPTDKSPDLLTVTERSIIAHYDGFPPGGVPTTIDCDNTASGRYLFVLMTSIDYLSICEMEVYATF